MFTCLEAISLNLYERYLTVERNIKARSNSFYDSYLDLQEQFIKLVLAEQAFEIKVQETCGAILRKDDVRAYFLEGLGIDEYTYNKMQDYTLKVNAHKHKGEKTVQIETIVNYLPSPLTRKARALPSITLTRITTSPFSPSLRRRTPT